MPKEIPFKHPQEFLDHHVGESTEISEDLLFPKLAENIKALTPEERIIFCVTRYTIRSNNHRSAFIFHLYDRDRELLRAVIEGMTVTDKMKLLLAEIPNDEERGEKKVTFIYWLIKNRDFELFDLSLYLSVLTGATDDFLDALKTIFFKTKDFEFYSLSLNERIKVLLASTCTFKSKDQKEFSISIETLLAIYFGDILTSRMFFEKYLEDKRKETNTSPEEYLKLLVKPALHYQFYYNNGKFQPVFGILLEKRRIKSKEYTLEERKFLLLNNNGLLAHAINNSSNLDEDEILKWLDGFSTDEIILAFSDSNQENNEEFLKEIYKNIFDKYKKLYQKLIENKVIRKEIYFDHIREYLKKNYWIENVVNIIGSLRNNEATEIIESYLENNPNRSMVIKILKKLDEKSIVDTLNLSYKGESLLISLIKEESYFNEKEVRYSKDNMVSLYEILEKVSKENIDNIDDLSKYLSAARKTYFYDRAPSLFRIINKLPNEKRLLEFKKLIREGLAKKPEFDKFFEELNPVEIVNFLTTSMKSYELERPIYSLEQPIIEIYSEYLDIFNILNKLNINQKLRLYQGKIDVNNTIFYFLSKKFHGNSKVIDEVVKDLSYINLVNLIKMDLYYILGIGIQECYIPIIKRYSNKEQISIYVSLDLNNFSNDKNFYFIENAKENEIVEALSEPSNEKEFLNTIELFSKASDKNKMEFHQVFVNIFLLNNLIFKEEYIARLMHFYIKNNMVVNIKEIFGISSASVKLMIVSGLYENLSLRNFLKFLSSLDDNDVIYVLNEDFFKGKSILNEVVSGQVIYDGEFYKDIITLLSKLPKNERKSILLKKLDHHPCFFDSIIVGTRDFADYDFSSFLLHGMSYRDIVELFSQAKSNINRMSETQKGFVINKIRNRLENFVGLNRNDELIAGFSLVFNFLNPEDCFNTVEDRSHFLLLETRPLLNEILQSTLSQAQLIRKIEQWTAGLGPEHIVQALSPANPVPGQRNPLFDHAVQRGYQNLINFLIDHGVQIEFQEAANMAPDGIIPQAIHIDTIKHTVSESLMALENHIPLTNEQRAEAIEWFEYFRDHILYEKIKTLLIKISQLNKDDPNYDLEHEQLLLRIVDHEITIRAFHQFLQPDYLTYKSSEGIRFMNMLTYIYYAVSFCADKEHFYDIIIDKIKYVFRGYNDYIYDDDPDKKICFNGTNNNLVILLEPFYPRHVWINNEEEISLLMKGINKLSELLQEAFKDPEKSKEFIKAFARSDRGIHFLKKFIADFSKTHEDILRSYLSTFLVSDKFNPPRYALGSKDHCDALVNKAMNLLLDPKFSKYPKDLIKLVERKILKNFKEREKGFARYEKNQVPYEFTHEDAPGGIHEHVSGHIVVHNQQDETPYLIAQGVMKAPAKPALFYYGLLVAPQISEELTGQYKELHHASHYAGSTYDVKFAEKFPASFIAMAQDQTLMEDISHRLQGRNRNAIITLYDDIFAERSGAWLESWDDYESTLKALEIPLQDRSMEAQEQCINEHSNTIYSALFQISVHHLRSAINPKPLPSSHPA